MMQDKAIASIEAANNALKTLNTRLMAAEAAIESLVGATAGDEPPLAALTARVNSIEERLTGFIASLAAQITALENSLAAIPTTTAAQIADLVEDVTEIRDSTVGFRTALADYVDRDRLSITREMVVRIMAEEAAKTPK
jgi:seryl-tRNA synthetase